MNNDTELARIALEDPRTKAELLARIAELEQDVRNLEADPDRPTVTYAGDELEAAEARIEVEVELRKAAYARIVTLERACRETVARIAGVMGTHRP